MSSRTKVPSSANNPADHCLRPLLKALLLVSSFKLAGRGFQSFAPFESRLTKRGLVHWDKTITTDGGLCLP